MADKGQTVETVDIKKWINTLIGKDLDKAMKIAKKHGYKVYKDDPDVEYNSMNNIILVKTISEVPVAPKGYEFCAFGPVDTVTKIVSY